ncbi:MAG: DUF2111 domain-containing protein [Methanosarcinales archaeon]|nr:DUF2111 domain-containing protein [ANME-2 cluster archaeon]MDF1531286.1 DUF2111 domain-containing protein [ANME-2 cluster archaeon]MDW7776144.1 DUF2111 domain-containing protein [Methanosarcinales archaeon]
MVGIAITRDSTAQELEPIAMAIFSAVGLPVTMRSKNKKGIRIENNKVLDYNYTGAYLERAMEEGKTIHGFADKGPYKDVPVVVSPIKDSNGEVVGAIGVVNLAGFIDLTRL